MPYLVDSRRTLGTKDTRSIWVPSFKCRGRRCFRPSAIIWVWREDLSERLAELEDRCIAQVIHGCPACTNFNVKRDAKMHRLGWLRGEQRATGPLAAERKPGRHVLRAPWTPAEKEVRRRKAIKRTRDWQKAQFLKGRGQ